MAARRPPFNAARRMARGAAAMTLGLGLATGSLGQVTSPLSAFRKDIEPVIKEYCFDCHGDGSKKGGVSFDESGSADALTLTGDHDLWLKALKNLRAGLMPPPGKPQPGTGQKQQVEQWIKASVFSLDPANPDPGRVTVRRLNRVEYRNTIRDLLGLDFDTEKEFPADDASHGFDNLGEVLTLPPMLLEKYLAAAKSLVGKAVPAVPYVPAEALIPGTDFRGAPGSSGRTTSSRTGPDARVLSYYEQASISNLFPVTHAGRYQLLLDFTANERYVDNQFDYNKCRLVFRVDGRELLNQEYGREGGRALHYEFDQQWSPGTRELVLELHPLTPDQKQVRSLSLRIDSLTVRGPFDRERWVRPRNFERFFTRDAPEPPSERRQYAREILEPFLLKAYRRAVDAETLDRLVAIAESTYDQPGKTVEAGIGQAMVAVLASPRFLFREEGTEPTQGTRHPLVDDYALASRLSYFLWSSMPDDELLRLAGEKRLRPALAAQTRRMLADPKSEALIRNFVGQWLQTRDIETVQIDARQVLGREGSGDPERERRGQRLRELRSKPEADLTPEEKKELDTLRNSANRRAGPPPLRADLTGDLRRAMRQETERTFEYVLRNDRSLLELLDSDYTFLNERLATHYGLTNLNVTGDEMVRVTLPPGSPRGGVITHGSVLAVTSNPTRTSPVKRGLFILDNLLGTPPPPPPPDIPPLEDAARAIKEKTLTLRETLALHREQPLCSSCHNRMDPLGLALENFNAMGMWRDQERGQPIDATGRLLSGEDFTNIRELKQILARNHATAFYRTLTEKLLTYALGRGLEYYDVDTVDTVVERLEKSGGRPSELLTGILHSAPFQKIRHSYPEKNSQPASPAVHRAGAEAPP